MNSAKQETAATPALRRAGLIVILYAFMHSYYGVGSLKNSLGSTPLSGAGFFLALAFGLCWIGLFLGGALLLARRRTGITVARAAAWIAAVVQIAGIVQFWSSVGQDLRGLLFTFSPPVYALFLALALPKLVSNEEPDHAEGLYPWPIIASGALLPWIAGLGIKLVSSAPLTPPQGIGFLISLFMTLWCTIPFGVLALTIRSWPAGRSGNAVLLGGFTGLIAASLYGYGLIWLQGFNAFIMALLPPLVFAGQAVGIVAAILFTRLSRQVK